MTRLAALLLFLLTMNAYGQSDASWIRILPSDTIQCRDARCLSVSPEGHLYIADTGHHRVFVLDENGKLIVETGGFGSSHGQFQWPRAVVADRGNAVWVLDYGNRRIEKFTRSLEYQGTFTVAVPNEIAGRQIEAMAISPQGDLYVFDRDGSRLLHYDPLFQQMAELGSRSGVEFISSISSMTFVPRSGLYWWTRGSSRVAHTDALLNPAQDFTLKGAPETLALASSDSCLLYASSGGILRLCPESGVPDTLVSPELLAAAGIARVTSLALTPDQQLVVLDGSANAVYRIKIRE